MNNLSQNELNADMVQTGSARYRGKVESARNRDAEIETKYGQRLMRSMLPKFTKAINDWQKQVRKYDRKARYQIDTMNLDPKLLGFIAIKSVLDSISKRKPLSHVSIFLGARIEDELRCRFLCETNEEKSKGILLGAKRRKGLKARIRHIRGSMKHETAKRDKPEWDKWALRDKLNMGLHMIELLKASTGIIEYIFILEKRKQKPTRYVSATPQLLQWIEEYNSDRELLEPFWMPTVDVPKDWVNIWDGGYDEGAYFLPKVPFIKTTNMDFLRNVENNLPEPMKAVNLIQQTPWQVNKDVFTIMEWAWEHNIEIGDLPNREDEEFPVVPNDFKTNEKANREWRRQAAKIYEFNLSTKSRRLLTAKILFLAKKFMSNRFFYPSQTDFRGRIYNIPSFLAIQGGDISRALLEFNRPMKIKTKEDARWLAIHGANTFGNDKVTLEEREQWAYDFAKQAQEIAKNPKVNNSWTKADKPWQFLAWCFEWAEWTLNNKLKTRLPVSMDATNNGLQILSLLMRDEEGAKATNVSNTQTPQDIYGRVADRVIDKLKIDSNKGNRIASTWLRFGIDRKLAKRPTMVFPYGGTFYSCRAYVDEWYQDCIRKKNKVNPFNEEVRYQVTGYLAKLVWASINEELDKPTKCMNWLKKCAEIMVENNVPIKWITPTGFPVLQDYMQFSTQEVKTKIGDKATHVSFRVGNDRKCKRSNRNGISPNFVHSLDAALLTRSVIKANEQGIYDFAMIHDSYGTHSNNCEIFSKILREECLSLFSVDLLRDFKVQLQSLNENIQLPDIPEYGNFDVEEVISSKYFFS